MVVHAVVLLIACGLYHRPNCPISGLKWDSSIPYAPRWRHTSVVSARARCAQDGPVAKFVSEPRNGRMSLVFRTGYPHKSRHWSVTFTAIFKLCDRLPTTRPQHGCDNQRL